MPETKTATPREMLWIGALFAAIGLYFILVGTGVLPIPGGPRNLHGPLWLVLCAGLAFFLGGAAAMMQGFGRANASGELPADAPRWMRVVQYFFGVAIFVCFAAMGSWMAFGPGMRHFSGTFAWGETIGRAAFGLGAIITWLCTAAYAVSGARKLLGQNRTSPNA